MSLHWVQIWPEDIAAHHMVRPQGILITTAVLWLVMPCSRGSSKVRISLSITISAILPYGKFFILIVQITDGLSF